MVDIYKGMTLPDDPAIRRLQRRPNPATEEDAGRRLADEIVIATDEFVVLRRGLDQALARFREMGMTATADALSELARP